MSDTTIPKEVDWIFINLLAATLFEPVRVTRIQCTAPVLFNLAKQYELNRRDFITFQDHDEKTKYLLKGHTLEEFALAWMTAFHNVLKEEERLKKGVIDA